MPTINNESIARMMQGLGQPAQDQPREYYAMRGMLSPDEENAAFMAAKAAGASPYATDSQLTHLRQMAAQPGYAASERASADLNARRAEERQRVAQENKVKMLGSLGDTAAKTGMDVRQLASMVGVDLGQAPGQADDRGVLGAQAGLPPPPPQANAGLSRALREKLQLAAAKSQDKRIAGMEEHQGTMDATEQQVNRFLERNAATPTGGAYSIPGVKQGLTMFSPARQEMEAITAQMVPVVGRQGLPGAASNLDVQMFKQAVPGQDKSLEANMAIGNAIIQQAQRGREHTDYLRTYADTYGSLTGADAAWQKYANDNPIFDPQAAAAGKTKLNAGRKSWAEYFAGQRGTTPAAAPAAGRPPLSSFAR
jgi:hypothetical protein